MINLASSTGDIEIKADGSFTIIYPDVADKALTVKSDNGSQNTVAWADVKGLLDPQASSSTGSGSTGN